MNYGITRLVQDLEALQFPGVTTTIAGGVTYAIIPDYKIPVGRFADRVINLAIPAPADYPRSFGASIHVTPLLYPFEHIPNVRNIIASGLGGEWQYWSHRFNARPDSENITRELITQINGVFYRCQ